MVKIIMTEEYLNEIEKDNQGIMINPSKKIQQLIDEIRTLRKLVEAVDNKYDYPIACWDIDGENWFDVRKEVLNQE